MDRLEVEAPELVAKLRRASPAKRRAAILAACEFAIENADVRHPVVEPALARIRAGEPFTSHEQFDLDSLAARLDDEYFGLLEAFDEGRGTIKDYSRVFRQARAVAALSLAADKSTFRAAMESIYEAAFATANRAGLFDVIHAKLE